MAATDAVGSATEPERGLRYPERFARIIRSRPPERDHLGCGNAQLLDQPSDRITHLLGWIGVVAGGHGGVGRKDGASTRAFEHFRVTVCTAGAIAVGSEHQRCDRAVPLV